MEMMSEWFDTTTGLKQGCLLSPLLFSLFINDLHSYLGGGLKIQEEHIRLLMYADDLVIIADEPWVLQEMIAKLEVYCKNWNLTVNLEKSKIMIFQKAGRQNKREKWFYNGKEVEIVKSYKYLGMLLTPGLGMNKNIADRVKTAKTGLNLTWNLFVRNKDIVFHTKYDLFQAVSRAISCYGAQIWGNKKYEELEKLQRYFVKKALGVTSTTPNYAIKLETGILDMYQHTMKIHMSFILKIMFEYGEERLPKKLANIIIQKKIDWWEDWEEIGSRTGVNWNKENPVENVWRENVIRCLQKINLDSWENAWSNAERSSHGLYRFLNYDTGCSYVKNIKDGIKVKWIF